MIALTLTQPWATLVAIGAKRIETRSWATNHRGELAIHAAQGFPRAAQELVTARPYQRALGRHGYGSPADLPRGAVVAIARLTDCQPTHHIGSVSGDELSFGDFRFGRYGWFLHDVRRVVTPIRARGALRLWRWLPPTDLARSLVP